MNTKENLSLIYYLNLDQGNCLYVNFGLMELPDTNLWRVNSRNQAELSFIFVSSVGLPLWRSGKESSCSAGDAGVVGSIPGSGRSPGGGHYNPLQFYCLENAMDRGAWQAAVLGTVKSWTRLKPLSTHARVSRDAWLQGFTEGVFLSRTSF